MVVGSSPPTGEIDGRQDAAPRSVAGWDAARVIRMVVAWFMMFLLSTGIVVRNPRALFRSGGSFHPVAPPAPPGMDEVLDPNRFSSRPLDQSWPDRVLAAGDREPVVEHEARLADRIDRLA